MLLVSNRRFVGVFIALMLLHVGELFFIYYQVITTDDAQYTAQTIVFAMAVLTSFQLWLVWTLYRRGRSVNRELTLLENNIGTVQHSPERIARTLGDFGVQLNAVMHKIAALSEKRWLKIDAQKHLLDVTMEMIDTFFFVCNNEGRVVYASACAENTITVPKPQRRIEDVWPYFSMKTVLAHFALNELSFEAANRFCYPLYDAHGQLHYVLCFNGPVENHQHFLEGHLASSGKALRLHRIMSLLEKQ